jgi:hypothetical protein
MNKRLLLMINLLAASINILIAETDAIWTSNPLDTIPSNYSGNATQPWDIAAAWDFPIFMLGFAFIRATDASLEAFTHVFAVFDSHIQHYEDEGFTVWNEAHEGFVFRDYVRSNQNQIRVVILAPELHLGGMWYSDVSSIQTCRIPVTIQNNGIAGNTAKMARSKLFGHWFLEETESTCRGNSPQEVVQSVNQWLICRQSPFVGLCGPGCIGTQTGGSVWTRELSNESVVYSIFAGSEGAVSPDLSFEIGLAARYGVTIHLIDPYCKAHEAFWEVHAILLNAEPNRSMLLNGSRLAEYYEMVGSSTVQLKQLQYHSNCKASQQYSVSKNPETNWMNSNQFLQAGRNSILWQEKSLSKMMAELGHSHVDLLRSDSDEGIDVGSINTHPDFVITRNCSNNKFLSALVSSSKYHIIATAKSQLVTLEKTPRYVIERAFACFQECMHNAMTRQH